jgi:transcriptional antiterminator RfaH
VTEPYWAVAATRPRSEFKAERNLRNQGYAVHLPRFLDRRRVDLLFPGYILVKIVDVWHSILSTIGVAYVVRGTDKFSPPARLPNSFIDGLRSRENTEGVVVLPVRRYERGQRIVVDHGVFAGRSAVYVGMSARQREIVLLGSLGRVELGAGDLV